MPEFKEEFFEDEVLEGFYVPSMIKRCWAVELEVLYEFDRICQRHGIVYFADWGTLLAAVRHGGMTPWDDDMDVVMTRNEFERFYAAAQDELPSEYHFVRFETSETCWQFIINLMSNSKMCFDKDYMERHHGFPYMAGLDIFILDNYCPDAGKAEDWRNAIKRILSAADLMWEEKLVGKKLEKELLELEKLTGAKLKRKGSLYERRLELYVLARNECAKYNGETTEYISQMLPWGIFYNAFHPRKDYEYAVKIPFENIEISVPVYYHKLLTEKYHDYYHVRKNGSMSHDYPFFEGQRKALGEDIDFVPQFRFSGEMLSDGEEERIPLIKRYSLEFIRFFEKMSVRFADLKKADGRYDFGGISMDDLIDCQNQAITYGQYLEEVKGEEFPVVRILERYCEAVYQLSEAVSQAKALDVTDVCRITDELVKSVQDTILDRITVVFVPYKAKYWHVFHSIWKAAKEDRACDVYVVPSPYQYKKYDGTLMHGRCELTGYPEDVTVTPYTEFDFEKTGADVIYFQNPYDNYNMAVSALPKFYSSNLKRNCKMLVYIPYFREDDFTETDEKQYSNMKYYCTMPGVVNADRVILASQALKQVYIRKLCEFAGEGTEEIWESKISGAGSGLYAVNAKENAAGELCKRGISLESCKWIVFYTSVSCLYEKGKKALEKIRRVLDSLSRCREGISFIWMIDPAVRRYLPKLDPDLASEIFKTAGEYSVYGRVMEETGQAGLLAEFCDAYYGDPSAVMQKFVNASKPVMICDYDV